MQYYLMLSHALKPLKYDLNEINSKVCVGGVLHSGRIEDALLSSCVCANFVNFMNAPQHSIFFVYAVKVLGSGSLDWGLRPLMPFP